MIKKAGKVNLVQECTMELTYDNNMLTWLYKVNLGFCELNFDWF